MADNLQSLRLPDMPNGDQAAEMWLGNFLHALARDGGPPQHYGVSGELFDRIWIAVEAFSKAYTVSRNPGTRTPVAVEAKTLRRNEAVLLVREAIKMIEAHWAQSHHGRELPDSERIVLGLRRLFDSRGRRVSFAAREAQLQKRRQRARERYVTPRA